VSRATDLRARRRRLAFGLATIFGLAPRGFFIPHRYAGSAKPTSYPALLPLFEAAGANMEGVLQAIDAYGADLLRILADRGPARFDQDWFPRLDAAAAYALVRRERPQRVVEIGSGHSSRFFAGAIADGGLATELVCIDPAPRASLAQLTLRHEKQLLSDVDPHRFEALRSGDILFIDSSHIAMPGTDVDRLFLDILPRLDSGVLVHVHDVFLPDAYPAAWTWRGYNEQLLAGALLQGRGYDIVFASHYVVAQRPEWIARNVLTQLPLMPGAHETSLWLRKS
jgi:predicted O-methyltransferase YrrM